tara:strand:+ start:795 stop:2255 length:1461 start_codon:yes stop_codon:yes gene_type:complete
MKLNNLNKIARTLFVAAIITCSGTAQAKQTEKLTSLEDQKTVAVTIYNENLALIKDHRTIKLDSGFNLLAFRGVSAKMRPETSLLRSLKNENSFNILEQNFDFDLLTPQKLLEKYVGKKVKIATMNPVTGEELIEEATVLSTNQGVVVKIGDRIEMNPRGRYIFDKVPENLRDQPTLVLQLSSQSSQPQDVELSYLSSGLSWKADYVAELSADDTKLNLMGWVTLNNKSGTAYNNAKLQLVAGDVNVVKHDFRQRLENRPMAAMKSTVAEDSFSEESLFEYHLYSLNRPTTLSNNQTKQVSLLTTSQVPVNKEFLLQGSPYYYQSSYGNIGQKLKVGVFVEFKNKEKSGLGIPLPKGVVRVYKKDKSGNAQFIGEDKIDHTPKNEDIRLKLGDAFDITADKNQTNFEKRNAHGKYNYAYESSYEIELKNAKSESVTVVVREPVPGDWKMLEDSHSFKKVAAGTAEWHIEVPAESSTTLKYTVLVRH